ncbi:MAG: hypothetical protein AAGE59_05670 [Cyanobacteria bacterium P01_F01_bin.86]
MDSSEAIALHVIQKDDKHSDEKTETIRSLMMCARFTPEGSLQRKSEIRFYESRKELNRMLIATGNQELIRMNAIKILYRMIAEAEIPSWEKTDDRKLYQEAIDEYSQYLEVLSNR